MSITENSTAKQVFAIIGVIGTIVAILGGSFQIYKNYIEKPELIVECVPTPFFTPPFQITDSLSKKYFGYDRPLPAEYRRASMQDFSITDAYVSLRAISTIWSYSIKNTGSTEIKEINFINDFEGYYSLTITGEESIFADCSSKIQIKSLSPTSEANLIIWATNKSMSDLNAPELFLARIKVVYPNGTAKIDYAKVVNGWGKSTSRILLIVLIISALIITAFIFVIIDIKAKRQRAKDDSLD